MNCLNCGTEMSNYNVVTQAARLSYNACDRCGSLWLDAGELDKMAFQVKGSIEYCAKGDPAVADAQPRKCPRCDDSTLALVKFLKCDDILLHFCPNCEGFWLDGGQLNLVDRELATIMPVSGAGFSDFVNNVYVPYWFRRLKRPSTDTDFRVEVLPLKGAERTGRTDDICPACGMPLDAYRADGVSVEGCPKCKGLWLDKDAMRRLKNHADEGSLRWLNDEIDNIEKAVVIGSKRRCARCKDATLRSVIFGKSSVVLDWCPACRGVWLDRDELDGIAAYLKSESMKMSVADMASTAAADLARAVRGGRESRFSELLDAKAALSALVNVEIFEHPALFALLINPPVR